MIKFANDRVMERSCVSVCESLPVAVCGRNSQFQKGNSKRKDGS